MKRKHLKIKTASNTFQQGDVILCGGAIPEKSIIDLGNRGVIQEGEHTGHKHQFINPATVRMYTRDTDHKTKHWNDVISKIVDLTTPQALKHEEHKPIDLPADRYTVSIVQEYDYERDEARKVAD